MPSRWVIAASRYISARVAPLPWTSTAQVLPEPGKYVAGMSPRGDG